MALIVQKFGGSSVRDRERIFNVARIVAQTHNAGNDVVVVVSAQGDTTDDTLLELIFAVLLPAIGSAIVFNIGASTGGTDIVAMILTRHSSLNIGSALMASDVLIVCGAALIFGVSSGLYSFLGLIGKSFVVDGVIESINQRKVCTVVTANPEDVTDFILDTLHRSATIEEAQGAYTGKELTVVMTVLTRREATQLRNFLRLNDNHAFITIVNSSEIIGKGFRAA